MIGRLARNDHAGVTMLAAMSMMACIGAVALAVDLGAIYFDSRRLQGMADAAALSAAGELGQAEAAARAAVDANGWHAPVSIQVELGRYVPDPAQVIDDRFTAGGADANATRITLEADSRLYFGIASLGRPSLRIRRTATAARSDVASFAIGSRLLALQGGIANALLGGLTGSQISLTAMDYQALLDADVDLLTFSDALRTELGLTGASYDEVLASEIAAPDALRLLARSTQGTAESALTAIANATRAETIRLDRALDLGPIGPRDTVSGHQTIRVNAFDLARTMLELANGERQVALDLGANVPGLLDADVKLAIGERPADSPWLTVTEKGEPIVRTSQARLYIETRLMPVGAAGGIASVRLPLLVELAEAEAKLSAINCASRGQPETTLLVRPAVGHVAIADIGTSDLGDHRTPVSEGPARLVSLPLIKVTGQARVDLTGEDWRTLSFSSAEIAASSVKTVSASTPIQGIVGSLISKVDIDASVAGLGLGLAPVTSLVGNTLAPAAAPLDGLLDTLTGLLGIRIGQADVRINGVRCGIPALVA